MSVRVRVNKQPLKVRVGQTDAIKILSSSGASKIQGIDPDATSFFNRLDVTGIATFGSSVAIQGDLNVAQNLVFNNLNLTNLNISGITTTNTLSVTGTLTAGLIDGGSF